MGKKFYVVVVGRETGICDTWIECKGRTKNIPEAVFEGFETYEEADRAYRGALQRGEVEVIQGNKGASASARRTKHRSSSPEEFDNGLDDDLFQPVTPSRRMGWVRARTMQSHDSLYEMSLLHSPSQTLPPSPPTGVTQYVELEDSPLFQPHGKSSPRVTVEDTSYTASPLPPKFRPAPIRKVETSRTSSMTSIEETSSPRVLRRQVTAPASFEMGARYPTVEEIRNGQNLDPRVMRPPSRIFDPANVKSRPKASSASRKQPANTQMDAESTSPCDATTRLVSDRLPSVNYLEDDENSSISSLPRRRVANKGKSRALADTATEILSASGSLHSNKRQSFSEYSNHIQEVYMVDRPEQCSVVVVRCLPGNSCSHGQCESMHASATVRSDGVRPQSHYVDAEVSPILSSVSSARKTSPRKATVLEPVARVSDASSGQGVHSLLGLSYSPQVPSRRYAAESDVRSPFARGTRVPSGLSE
ncbi:hypothetical protein K503DRAFT_34478 [Rhizopogon vinicolor AM-OR11-026]|uniref:Ribonuclease H1 N-terminal domain-containing protein n=1 Tax=Rhizopogon vinicolor AM-OR11-026 TaxID=1314800 RepID=A0A1B7N560_9AGAM|nr:hypothetical protein K503DRAFT_34478 [Rhizopogon vinicolor AM-OR11-026]